MAWCHIEKRAIIVLSRSHAIIEGHIISRASSSGNGPTAVWPRNYLSARFDVGSTSHNTCWLVGGTKNDMTTIRFCEWNILFCSFSHLWLFHSFIKSRLIHNSKLCNSAALDSMVKVICGWPALLNLTVAIVKATLRVPCNYLHMHGTPCSLFIGKQNDFWKPTLFKEVFCCRRQVYSNMGVSHEFTNVSLTKWLSETLNSCELEINWIRRKGNFVGWPQYLLFKMDLLLKTLSLCTGGKHCKWQAQKMQNVGVLDQNFTGTNSELIRLYRQPNFVATITDARHGKVSWRQLFWRNSELHETVQPFCSPRSRLPIRRCKFYELRVHVYNFTTLKQVHERSIAKPIDVPNSQSLVTTYDIYEWNFHAEVKLNHRPLLDHIAGSIIALGWPTCHDPKLLAECDCETSV